jgi:hypothetical protein
MSADILADVKAVFDDLGSRFGFTPADFDNLVTFQLTDMACAHLLAVEKPDPIDDCCIEPEEIWPFEDDGSFRPLDITQEENLLVAAALILKEIERRRRAVTRGTDRLSAL